MITSPSVRSSAAARSSTGHDHFVRREPLADNGSGAHMPLVGLTELLTDARDRGVAIGAFNVFSLEHAEALVAGAEQAGSPVVLQVSQNAVRYHGALAPIGLATLALARASTVPCVVHLDHATDVDLVHEAVELGFTSVMFDG